MNKRVSYGKNTPLSFRESIRFSAECPYKIRCKDSANEDIAPPHYAQTVEIDICCGIRGEIMIENEQFQIDGDGVYVIPPGIVHATTIHKGDGHIYVLHISPEELSGIVNIEILLRQSGKTFHGMPRICPDFLRVHELVLELIRRDLEPFARSRALLQILEILVEQMPASQTENREDTANKDLHRILRWTEANFTETVRLEDAAAVVGFSKNYFCAWFKSHTGLTYNHYVNNLRINHACRILIQTRSIPSACYDSGFKDMSYFIQIFKKMQGCTPKEYISNSNSE